MLGYAAATNTRFSADRTSRQVFSSATSAHERGRRFADADDRDAREISRYQRRAYREMIAYFRFAIPDFAPLLAHRHEFSE